MDLFRCIPFLLLSQLAQEIRAVSHMDAMYDTCSKVCNFPSSSTTTKAHRSTAAQHMTSLPPSVVTETTITSRTTESKKTTTNRQEQTGHQTISSVSAISRSTTLPNTTMKLNVTTTKRPTVPYTVTPLHNETSNNTNTQLISTTTEKIITDPLVNPTTVGVLSTQHSDHTLESSDTTTRTDHTSESSADTTTQQNGHTSESSYTTMKRNSHTSESSGDTTTQQNDHTSESSGDTTTQQNGHTSESSYTTMKRNGHTSESSGDTTTQQNSHTSESSYTTMKRNGHTSESSGDTTTQQNDITSDTTTPIYTSKSRTNAEEASAMQATSDAFTPTASATSISQDTTTAYHTSTSIHNAASSQRIHNTSPSTISPYRTNTTTTDSLKPTINDVTTQNVRNRTATSATLHMTTGSPTNSSLTTTRVINVHDTSATQSGHQQNITDMATSTAVDINTNQNLASMTTNSNLHTDAVSITTSVAQPRTTILPTTSSTTRDTPTTTSATQGHTTSSSVHTNASATTMPSSSESTLPGSSTTTSHSDIIATNTAEASSENMISHSTNTNDISSVTMTTNGKRTDETSHLSTVSINNSNHTTRSPTNSESSVANTASTSASIRRKRAAAKEAKSSPPSYPILTSTQGVGTLPYHLEQMSTNDDTSATSHRTDISPVAVHSTPGSNNNVETTIARRTISTVTEQDTTPTQTQQATDDATTAHTGIQQTERGTVSLNPLDNVTEAGITISVERQFATDQTTRNPIEGNSTEQGTTNQEQQVTKDGISASYDHSATGQHTSEQGIPQSHTTINQETTEQSRTRGGLTLYSSVSVASTTSPVAVEHSSSTNGSTTKRPSIDTSIRHVTTSTPNNNMLSTPRSMATDSASSQSVAPNTCEQFCLMHGGTFIGQYNRSLPTTRKSQLSTTSQTPSRYENKDLLWGSALFKLNFSISFDINGMYSDTASMEYKSFTNNLRKKILELYLSCPGLHGVDIRRIRNGEHLTCEYSLDIAASVNKDKIINDTFDYVSNVSRSLQNLTELQGVGNLTDGYLSSHSGTELKAAYSALRDPCRAFKICPTGHNCHSSSIGGYTCAHRCANDNPCMYDGVCYINEQDRIKCRCKSDGTYTYYGNNCEQREELLELSYKYIIVICVCGTAGLAILLSMIVYVCKRRRNDGFSYEAGYLTDMDAGYERLPSGYDNKSYTYEQDVRLEDGREYAVLRDPGTNTKTLVYQPSKKHKDRYKDTSLELSSKVTSDFYSSSYMDSNNAFKSISKESDDGPSLEKVSTRM